MLIKSFKSFLLLLLSLTLVTIARSQNVGIGTSVPSGRLHIDMNGAPNNFAILIDDEDADIPTIRIRKNGVSKAFALVQGDDFKIGTYGTNPNGKLILQTDSDDQMYITPAGNIGISYADPVSKLQIVGGTDASSAQNGFLMLGISTAENLVFDNNEILARNNGVVSTLFLGRDGSKVQLGNGPDETGTKLQITSGNDVDLPNANSGYMMMGSQAGINMIMDNNEIQVRNNGSASHMYLQNLGGNVFIGDATNFNSSHRLGVDGNAVILGAVRIGETVTPGGYKLAVDGKAICTELLVRLVPNWPDYVFNKQYKLRGIDEVENFIKKNNHLPGIPSAKEIESTGVNVGEMQKLQMEKIEELTLYIIELKKEIENLKAHQSRQ
jgi:hypothetical protein